MQSTAYYTFNGRIVNRQQNNAQPTRYVQSKFTGTQVFPTVRAVENPPPPPTPGRGKLYVD